jgi:hypothetical protein
MDFGTLASTIGQKLMPPISQCSLSPARVRSGCARDVTAMDLTKPCDQCGRLGKSSSIALTASGGLEISICVLIMLADREGSCFFDE